MSVQDRAEVVLKSGAAAAQPRDQAGRLSGTPLDALSCQTYLSVAEAADYLRFRSVKALREWASRARLPKCRAGRKVLFLRKDLDRTVQPEHIRERHRRSA